MKDNEKKKISQHRRIKDYNIEYESKYENALKTWCLGAFSYLGVISVPLFWEMGVEVSDPAFGGFDFYEYNMI